jgi:hypothetical protein
LAAFIVMTMSLPSLIATEAIGILAGKGIGTPDLSTVFRIVHRGVRGEFSSQRHKAFPAVAECKGNSMSAKGTWVLPEDKISVEVRLFRQAEQER